MIAKLRSSLLAPVLAIAASALLCGVILLLSGANPFDALGAMVGQVGEGQVAVDIVNSTAIYMLAALAAAIGFQMNLLNIGIEGQYRSGSRGAATWRTAKSKSPRKSRISASMSIRTASSSTSSTTCMRAIPGSCLSRSAATDH